MRNKNFTNAKKIKNDEYYTRMEDIDLELKNYISNFEDKII